MTAMVRPIILIKAIIISLITNQVISSIFNILSFRFYHLPAGHIVIVLAACSAIIHVPALKASHFVHTSLTLLFDSLPGLPVTGDIILVTWYNGSNEVVNYPNKTIFRPLISLEDENNPVNAEGEAWWYNMRKTKYDFLHNGTSYEIASVKPGEAAQSLYDIRSLNTI